MTEMVTYQPPQTLSLVDYQDRAVQRLSEWAQSASAAYEVARRLVGTSFCPAAYRGKPEEATAAILSGLEVGLSPMAALRAFDVIQGQAAPRAITLRAIVQSHGHDMRLIESTATRCKMKGRRKGDQEWQAITWTIDRAKDLGLTSKDGWKKQPIAMLLARATSELARLIAADAILGIGYSAEELGDGTVDGGTAPDEPAQPGGQRRMSRKPAAPEIAAAEPVETDDADIPADTDSVDATEAVELITGPQMKNVHRLLGKLGVGNDRDAGLAYLKEALGVEVASSKDLTLQQARVVIDFLMDLAGESDNA